MGSTSGFIVGNPFQGVELPKPKQRRRAFTDDERMTLLQKASPERLPVWRLLLLTGLRRRELADLTTDTVVLDSPAPFLRVMGKGRKRRDVPLTVAAVDVARELVADAKAEGREHVLPCGYDAIGVRWNKERDRLKLPTDLTLHSFRHSFATTLVNRTSTSLTEASRVLGHSSVVQTERYVHKDEAQLRQGMAMLDAEFDIANTVETASGERRFGT